MKTDIKLFAPEPGENDPDFYGDTARGGCMGIVIGLALAVALWGVWIYFAITLP